MRGHPDDDGETQKDGIGLVGNLARNLQTCLPLLRRVEFLFSGLGGMVPDEGMAEKKLNEHVSSGFHGVHSAPQDLQSTYFRDDVLAAMFA